MKKLNNQYIKHKNFMDLAIYIDRSVIVSGPYYIIRGSWINQGFVDTYTIGSKANIKILRSKINEWLICEDKYAKCIRYAKWNRI